MIETDWEKRLNGLRHQLASIKSRAHADTKRSQELWRQVECCKIQFLTYQLETRRKFLVQSRGGGSLSENKKGLAFVLGINAGVSILTGIFTEDRIAAMNTGVTGLSKTLRRLGETEWVVCLEKNLAVAPWDNIGQGRIWVTWESLMISLDELAVRAKDESLGNLDNIISELKKSRKLLFVIQAPTGGAPV